MVHLLTSVGAMSLEKEEVGYAWGCPLWLQGRALAPSCAQSTGWHCVSGPMLLWLAMAMLLVGSSSFFLCHWKACRRRIQQSRCLCLGVLGRVAALCWPALGACPACPYPAAHPLSPTLDIFAEFHLDYLTQTFQPKTEQGGEYLVVQRTAWARVDRCATVVGSGAGPTHTKALSTKGVLR